MAGFACNVVKVVYVGGPRPTYESQIEMSPIRRKQEVTELRITIKVKRLQWR